MKTWMLSRRIYEEIGEGEGRGRREKEGGKGRGGGRDGANKKDGEEMTIFTYPNKGSQAEMSPHTAHAIMQ